ncbi:MAG: 5-methyltetrahydrofolate--homocysteine methyltransferase, partial [Bacteroidaceae bacterium]|nr:5-methyltetrahydrofolate--homocysteine methyltransferase [Bacteroidaceae bacterium]
MIHTLIYHARETVRYINWLYFFHAWDFPARFASIAQVHACTSCRQGWILRFPSEERPQATEAARLYDEAMAMLREWDRAGLQTRFRVSLQAANSQGDDILLHESGLRLPLLRQQHT